MISQGWFGRLFGRRSTEDWLHLILLAGMCLTLCVYSVALLWLFSYLILSRCRHDYLLERVRRHFRRRQRNASREALKKEQEMQTRKESQRQQKLAKPTGTVDCPTQEHTSGSVAGQHGADNGKEKKDTDNPVGEENDFLCGTDDVLVSCCRRLSCRLLVLFLMRH